MNPVELLLQFASSVGLRATTQVTAEFTAVRLASPDPQTASENGTSHFYFTPQGALIQHFVLASND